MKDFKWTKGLNRSTIFNVLACEPIAVSYNVNYKERTVTCKVSTATASGQGIAICSCLDEFNVPKGKNIAARRAVLAMIDKSSSRPVRVDWHKFPNTWTKKRINRLKSFHGMYKCYYKEMIT